MPIISTTVINAMKDHASANNFIFFFILCVFTKTYAGTITSTAGGGTWATGSTWVGGIAPGAGDDVIIAGPVNVAAANCFIGYSNY